VAINGNKVVVWYPGEELEFTADGDSFIQEYHTIPKHWIQEVVRNKAPVTVTDNKVIDTDRIKYSDAAKRKYKLDKTRYASQTLFKLSLPLYNEKLEQENEKLESPGEFLKDSELQDKGVLQDFLTIFNREGSNFSPVVRQRAQNLVMWFKNWKDTDAPEGSDNKLGYYSDAPLKVYIITRLQARYVRARIDLLSGEVKSNDLALKKYLLNTVK